MKKTRSTKSALMSSVLALVLCFTMLLGTTFAWFTDSVTSAENKIVAGTLDVDLFLWNSETASVEITEESAPIFGANSLVAQNNAADTIWEPGKTQVVYLSIKNNGTLDLKYKVALEVTDVEKNIIDVLYYTITPDATWSQTPEAWDATNAKQVVAGTNVDTEDVKLEASKEHFFALSIHMDETAGNDYQGASVTFDIKILATQIASESDSFNNQYDKDAMYPVNITVSKPVTADGDNKTTEDVSITFADASSAVSEVKVVVPKETKLKTGATQLVLNVKEADGVNADVATQITSDQIATTYEISLDGVDATNDKDITVTLVIEKGLVDVQLYHKGTLIPCTYNADTGELTFSTKGFSPFTVVSATKVFEEGEGTADAPYMIKTAEDLLDISKYSHEYKYYKVADGVDTLDITGIGKIKLNGSFDGNGVTMNNLTTALFQSVGKVGVAQDIKISNLTANVNTTDGNALVRNIYNPGTTTFENVVLHGYIEGKYNMGSFYNYGTANAGDSDGADYTVSFVNATSDATLVCTTGNAIGGMLGHGYEGADYTLSINMDEASGYTGKMYTTGTATCYEVMALCSHATYVLNGVETSRSENKYPSTKLTAAAPTAKVDGYYVASVEGVDHYVVSLEAQLTAYDENGVKISNLAGLTWSLGKTTITEGFDGKIFDLVTSAEIVNDEDLKIGYDLSDGALTVYTGRDTNYASGWITLNVTQYDADGTILATGNTRVYTFVEP